ncbi:MAG TPA: DUF192 domain-containing protein [Candidatus Limnocylindrales bacterium]|nr:DUF192 domain-containing protein [Candidatus Limnocylindrales bacterium]
MADVRHRTLTRAATLAALALVASACAAPPASTATPTDLAVAVIETSAGEIRVRVEIAETPEERGRGLMSRDALDEDAGMVFLFEEPSTAAFHMLNTRIPLSIAFFDEDGTILRILDMVPCPGPAPCPTYDPGITYRAALEVNRGAFERWGVRVGDRIRLERP